MKTKIFLNKPLDYKIVSEDMINWVKKYSNDSKTKGFVVGVSGGVDSAVISTICSKTELPTLLLEMPIHQSKDQVTRAQEHIQWLKDNHSNVSSLRVDLTEAYDVLYKTFEYDDSKITTEEFDFSMSNTRSRLRMTTLYQYAGINKMIVVGTGNKVEDYGIGFFTKFGDGGVDLSPIGDLLKSEVYELASYLGVNENIIKAAPTDGLHEDGRTDEDQIGASYEELEWAMFIIDETCKKTFSMYPDFNEFRFKFLSDFDKVIASSKLIFGYFDEREIEVLRIYLKMHVNNSHKMDLPPIFSIKR